MFRDYRLAPLPGEQEIEFSIDFDTGEVRGRDSQRVRGLCRLARLDGYASVHPHPQSIVVTDPLHNITELAAILGDQWQLDGDLKAAYPQLDGGDPEDPPGTIY
ncbi:MAG: hypothetical protein ACKO0Z_20260 [Betaproteobacteria bacterium]